MAGLFVFLFMIEPDPVMEPTSTHLNKIKPFIKIHYVAFEGTENEI